MSKEKKLIPDLRFPDFLNEGKWKEDILGNRGEFIGGGTPSKENKSYWKGHIPWVSSSDISEDTIHHIDKTRFITPDAVKSSATKIIPKNSLLIVSRVGVGKVAITKERICTSQDFTNFTPSKDDLFFLGYYLKSCNDLLLRFSQGMAIKGFTKEDIYNLNLPFPDNILEQQKIADCLSSLDELIKAQNYKLQALKAHKKGLLQTFFPHDGGQGLKYRFPELDKDKEWDINKFSNFIKLYRGSSPRPIREFRTKSDDGVNWIKIGDTGSDDDFIISSVEEKITQKGAEKSRRVSKGELILANSMSYGKTYELDIAGCIYDGWFVLREYEESFDKQFLLQLLNSGYMQYQYEKYAAGGIVKNISSKIVYNTMLPRPSLDEQKKIASCLTECDKLIKAQKDKLEELELHKKGLTQGLFPKISD